MSSANVAVCVARESLKSARSAASSRSCRARSGFAPENLNAVRKVALTLLRRNGLPGKGVKDMRLECAWDFDQAVKVLFGGEAEEVR